MDEVGFPTKLFVSQEEIQDFLCPLCAGVLNNPVSTFNGCEFCQYCVMKQIDDAMGSFKCTKCFQEHVIVEKLNFCKRSRKIVNSLITKCSNSENTTTAPCPWRGPLQEYQAHITTCAFTVLDCKFKADEVGCSFDGCNGKVIRSDLNKHSKQTVFNLRQRISELTAQIEQVLAEKNALQAEKHADMVEIQGHMIKRFQDGSVYCGESSKGLRDGYGITTFSTDHWHRGQWVNNRMKGMGLLQTSDGSQYCGMFKHNVKSGEGTMTFADGGKYSGQWKDDHMHGQGKRFFSNGDEYTGSFANDVFCGHGTMKYADGRVYTGGWHQGEWNVAGVLTMPNGTTCSITTPPVDSVKPHIGVAWTKAMTMRLTESVKTYNYGFVNWRRVASDFESLSAAECQSKLIELGKTGPLTAREIALITERRPQKVPGYKYPRLKHGTWDELARELDRRDVSIFLSLWKKYIAERSGDVVAGRLHATL